MGGGGLTQLPHLTQLQLVASNFTVSIYKVLVILLQGGNIIYTIDFPFYFHSCVKTKKIVVAT